MSRCKAEKLGLDATAAGVDKLLAETGCIPPDGTVFSARKESAAAIVWLRAHATDSAEQFDALPAACQESIRGLHNIPLDAPGQHWARKAVRVMQAFTEADSPVKGGKQQAAKGGEGGFGEDQSRPDGEKDEVHEVEAGHGGKDKHAQDQDDKAARERRQRENELMLARDILSGAAKRQKDKSVLSPASLKHAAALGLEGRGGASKAAVKMQWLSRKVMEESLPETVFRAVWLGDKLKTEALIRAAKEEKDGLWNSSSFENTVTLQLFSHRLQFYMGERHGDAPDLNVVGKNLAAVTKMCLVVKETELEKMVTLRMKDAWMVAVGRLAGPSQIPESDLKEFFDYINALMRLREEILRAWLAEAPDAGEAGREVLKGAALQTKYVRGLWGWLAEGMADGQLTSPTRESANAIWFTVLAPAMDQRTGSAPNGNTSLAPAQARLNAARYALDTAGADPYGSGDGAGSEP